MTRNESNRARFGPYEVDLHTHELWKFGIRVKLVGQPFEILSMLLSRPGELVTRDEMRSRLWPSDTFVDFNHGLNAAVNKLRDALSDSAESPRYIETLPRRGYRFIGQVEWLEVHQVSPSLGNAGITVRPLVPAVRNSAPTIQLEPQPVPHFAVEPELALESAPAHSAWRRYFIGAGLLCTLVIMTALFVRPVSPFGEADAAHGMTEHTRPLLAVSDTGYPAFSPDGNSVAFRRYFYAGGSGIYVSPVGSDSPKQLTSNDGDDCPVWSHDGRFIAFTRRIGSSYSIHIIPFDGGRAEKREAETKTEARSVSFRPTPSASLDHELSTGGVSLARGELDWSPDGKFIAFSGADGLYMLSRDDSTIHRVTEAPQSSQDWGPAFSSDGKKILFVRDNQLDLSNEIRSVSLGGGDLKQIFSERGKITSSPQWSYDGRSVIFSSNRNGHPALWRVSLNSPAEAIQVSEAGSPAWDPAVSRRGYRLPFERLLRSLSIWQVDLAGPDKRPYLVVSSTSDTDQGPGPQFSPDGQKLAYMSDRSGTMEIWIANRDGGNPFQLTAVGGAGTPRWSPDSGAIVFDVGSNTGPKIVFVNLRDAMPQTLADGVCPSFSRDGKWIYFASARLGDWQVWKVPSEGGSPVQVTRHGGHAALESIDGQWIFYAKNPMAEPEVWRIPVRGGEESPVPQVRPGTWASWQVTKHGILFVGPSLGHQAALSFYDFAHQRTTTLAVLKRTPFWLGATTDGKLVAFDQPGQEQSQAMLVDNFR
jgi:Tol biopolymer transport system component/DNA-binding winged helix-turn-helix (wHTH) protein